MNLNAIIATLILKGIITEDEGQQLSDHLQSKPQSTVLKDSINEIKEFITMQPLTGGPEQQAEERAARERLAAEQKEAEEKAAAEAAENEDADDTATDEKEDTNKSSKK